MKPVSFNAHTYLIDGQPVYLYSGEFHYFRVPKADWRTRMHLFKQAGGNVLATYIPWLIHEPRENQFRFSGEDWLDLEGFLQTAQDEGLYVIARPGPYQYSELVYDGLPGWLVKDYPQILARNAAGKPFRESSVSYLHPLFLEKVQRWFDVVCPILARYTLEQGGPIAFIQLDNEMVGIHEWFGTLDYNPDTMGFGHTDGRYPRFLRTRYGEVRHLNLAYGSDYAKFESALPADNASDSVCALRRRKDYYDFYVGTIAEYSSILAQMIRAHGIQSPLVHNSGNPGMNAHFLETIQALGDQYLLGSDHYYNLNQEWPQNNPTPQYALRMFVSLEQLRLMGYPPTVFELPGGSASDWPPITPEDALACCMANLAFGMRGHNYYIFTGGPNPPGAGVNTDLYDYGAGIGPYGEIRPLYQAQKEFGEFIAHHNWLVNAERPCDVRFTLDFEQARSSYYTGKPIEGLYSSSEAWEMLRRGPLTAALCAGLSPAFVDLAISDWLHDISTSIVAVCSSCMSADKQQRLVDFLNRGGKVLFTPVLPAYDENLNPCHILLTALGAAEFSAAPVEQARPEIAGVVNVNGKAYFSNPPQDASTIGVDAFSGKTIAWQRTFPGGGQAAVVGLAWSHAMHEHERMLTAVLDLLVLRRILTTSNPNVWITLWKTKDATCLFMINLFTSPMQVSVDIHLPDRKVQIGPLSIPPMTVKIIDL